MTTIKTAIVVLLGGSRLGRDEAVVVGLHLYRRETRNQIGPGDKVLGHTTTWYDLGSMPLMTSKRG